MTRIGVVTIGRNEGERLIRCLKGAIALLPQNTPIIYVDSGSTDGSVEAVEFLGVQVINLDMSRPFTMARGRNTGFRSLVEQFSDTIYPVYRRRLRSDFSRDGTTDGNLG